MPGVVAVGADHHELVAAEPGDHVAGPGERHQPGGGVDEQLVAHPGPRGSRLRPAQSGGEGVHRRPQHGGDQAGAVEAQGQAAACDTRPVPTRRCPCGTGLSYAECCGRLHDGTATAATAEQLMRSRYSAFAVGDSAYLLATWHSGTRPRSLALDPAVRWTGLEVLATTGGTLLAAEGTVEFRASHLVGGQPGTQHERSRFVREDGRWRYVDGVALP